MNSQMDHPISHNTIYEYDDDPHRHDQNVGIEIAAQHVMPGQEGAARSHTHTNEPHFGERITGEGVRSKPSAYHTFDPATATHTPGHEETLGWSTDTGRSKEYDEQPYAPKNIPVGMLSGGGHSTGDLDKGKKGPPVKLGTVGGPTGVEEDPQVPKDVGADQGPVYQVRVIDPTGTAGLHRTAKEEMIPSLKSKFQGDFQTFDPSTTIYVPGHEDTLDWSRTDTGRLHRSEDLTNASTNTAIAAQSAYDSKTAPGLHRSEVDRRTEREGIMHPPKSKFQGDFQTFDPSTTRYVPGQEETLDWSRTDTGRPHRPEELSNVSKHTRIAAHPAAQSIPGQHRSTVSERNEREGALHSPKSKFLDDFQTFDPSAPSHVSGHEEALGWSRTDTGRLNRSEQPSNESKCSPIAANSGHDSSVAQMPQSFMPGEHRSKLRERNAMEGALDDPEDLLQGDRVTFAHTTASYVPGQDENINWFGSDTGILNEPEELSHASKNTPVAAHSGYDPTAAQSYMSGIQRRSKLGENTAMEGMIDAPGSNLQGNSLTFVPTTTNYVPGQEETWDWPKTDTGRPNRLEKLSNASKNTPIAAHTDRTYHMGADEERGTGKLGGLHENTGQGQILDTDPNSPRGLGERHRGIGSEKVGATPIMQLDKMNIYDEPHQNPRVGDAHLRRRRSPEDENIFTGSHDQFSPEPITTNTNTFFQDTSPSSERSHNIPGQKEESYTQKISSTAAMMADKAKQATNSVTSKLGYGGDSSDQHSADVSSGMNERSSEPVGYGEKISNVTSAITDKAVQAKDVVANKLGYGGNQEGQHHEKSDPMYGKVATVALKMQDSGTEREGHSSSTTEMDKGVSMKEYLAEKLRPGEEDKALSDVITGALPLHKRKEDVSKAGEEGKGDKVTITGRVTESEEVARQFGRGEETNYDDAGTGMASPGKGVLDRLKDAASFWFQKGTEIPSQDDMVEGNEGSPVISSMESEQKKEQKRVGGSGLQN